MKTEHTHKRRWLLWLIIGLLAYGLFLLTLLPAGLAWDQARARGMVPAGVEVQGITGTLWNGAAVRAVLPGGLQVNDLQWRATFTSLLAMRLGWDLEARPQGGRVAAHVAVGPGTVVLAGVRGDMPAAPVVAPFMTWPVRVNGRLVLDLERLQLAYSGQVREARGVLGWIDAAAGIPEALPLGDLRAEISDTGEGGLRLSIQDQGGPLIAEGVAEISAASGYRVEGVAGTRDGAHPNIGQALRMIGNPGRDGRVPVRLSGRL
ncbi:type II secretion system protein N [Thioalkalivibrio sulfidiphilus]|uniref:type II secretion system protein N n=1 Tax=Thioalkalivibrio sulfidiphilus TaxID=1033854 RepID=UPI003B2E012E